MRPWLRNCRFKVKNDQNKLLGERVPQLSQAALVFKNYLKGQRKGTREEK